MAMKMLGCELLADTFIHFYETQLHRNKARDPDTGEELYSVFGAYNFVPKKTQGTMSIVPTYPNKWPFWTNCWFYHRVSTYSDVESAQVNKRTQASHKVSQMIKLIGLRLPEFSMSKPEEIRTGDAFILTSRWQTSRDRIEAWIAIKRKPLCVYYCFKNIVDMDGTTRQMILRGGALLLTETVKKNKLPRKMSND